MTNGGGDLRDRARFLIHRRSLLELELILRDFWARCGDSLPTEDLPELLRVLESDDFEILEVLLGRRPAPDDWRADWPERIRGRGC